MYHDYACMTSATSGTGTLTLGIAVPGYNTFALAGVVNAEIVTYSIRDGSNSEIGRGTYTASGTTLSRDLVYSSTNGGNKINCSGSEQVFITPSSKILNSIDPYGLHHRLTGTHADDDEFDTDTSANYTAVTPSGTATWAIANHTLGIRFANQTSGDMCGFLKSVTLADGDWLETSFQYITQSYNYTFMGLMIADGNAVTSNCVCLSLLIQGTDYGAGIVRWDTGTITNITGSSGNQTIKLGLSGSMRMQLKRTNATTYNWYISTTAGTPFYDWGASTVNPGFTPTYGGLHVSTFGSGHNAIAAFDYYRHMS